MTPQSALLNYLESAKPPHLIKTGSNALQSRIWFVEQTELCREFVSAAVLFQLFFVFMPKLIQRAMKADANAAIKVFLKK